MWSICRTHSPTCDRRWSSGTDTCWLGAFVRPASREGAPREDGRISVVAADRGPGRPGTRPALSPGRRRPRGADGRRRAAPPGRGVAARVRGPGRPPPSTGRPGLGRVVVRPAGGGGARAGRSGSGSLVLVGLGRGAGAGLGSAGVPVARRAAGPA